mmetsp:Transcript_70643/g.153419  ORF Transcript_70643/g.153419 Transcript_70643/m.153419 type:complete len:202 (+) Transcript_70643:64-669(+)
MLVGQRPVSQVMSCALALSFGMSGQAMPASPLPVLLTQPDGTNITLHIRGDEKFHFFEDQGFTVVLSDGAYSYATSSADGHLAPTEHLVGHSDPWKSGSAPGLLPSKEALAELAARARPQGQGMPERLTQRRGAVGATRLKNIVVLCRFRDHRLGIHTRSHQTSEYCGIKRVGILLWLLQAVSMTGSSKTPLASWSLTLQS